MNTFFSTQEPNSTQTDKSPRYSSFSYEHVLYQIIITYNSYAHRILLEINIHTSQRQSFSPSVTMPFVYALETTAQQNVMNSTIHRFIIHVYIIKLWMRISFLRPLPSKIQKTASTMYKNKINVANKTNSSELVSPYIGFLSIFCTELSAPIGRDALCQRPSTTRLTTVNKVLHNR